VISPTISLLSPTLFRLANSLGLCVLPGKALVSALTLARDLFIEFRLCAMKLLLGFRDCLRFLRGGFPCAAGFAPLPFSRLKLAARAARARGARGVLLVASGFLVEPSRTCLLRRLLLTMTFQLLLAASDSALSRTH
jgi:hypothetical protein